GHRRQPDVAVRRVAEETVARERVVLAHVAVGRVVAGLAARHGYVRAALARVRVVVRGRLLIGQVGYELAPRAVAAHRVAGQRHVRAPGEDHARANRRAAGQP